MSARYRLGKLIGKGAMGEVYECEQVLGLAGSSRKRAVKFIIKPPGESVASVAAMKERFWREARALVEVSHPNVIDIIDFGMNYASEDLILVMEYVDGEDLEKLLLRSGTLSLGEALSITEQLLNGVSAVHACGIVHRDLKPANVFASQLASGRQHIKIADFGIARLGANQGRKVLTQEGGIVGTPLYAAPEQVRGDRVTSAADLYAVGVILFELLVGRAPFADFNWMEVLARKQVEDPPPLSQVRPELAHVRGLQELLSGLLHRSPEQRLTIAQALAKVDRIWRTADPVRSSGGTSWRVSQWFKLPKRHASKPTVSELSASTLAFIGITTKRRAFGATFAVLGAALAAVLLFTLASRRQTVRERPRRRASAATLANAALASPRSAALEPCPPGSDFIRSRRVHLAQPYPRHTWTFTTSQGKSLDVPAVCVDRAVVTVAQYGRCVRSGQCRPPERNACNASYYVSKDAPIDCITRNDAEAYCKFDEGRLPTIAVWESWSFAVRTNGSLGFREWARDEYPPKVFGVACQGAERCAGALWREAVRERGRLRPCDF